MKFTLKFQLLMYQYSHWASNSELLTGNAQLMEYGSLVPGTHWIEWILSMSLNGSNGRYYLSDALLNLMIASSYQLHPVVECCHTMSL